MNGLVGGHLLVGLGRPRLPLS